MKRLVPFDDDKYLLDIINSKSNEIKNSLQPAIQSVLELYGYYRCNLNALDQITQAFLIDTEVLQKIKLCYKQSTVKVEELKQQIKSLQINYTYCPYCGINTGDTFDHYLPISKFPEFSIFPLNLIPCCAECNRKKGDRHVSHPRKIINPYFDCFLETSFLKVRLDFSGSGVLAPTVVFDVDNSLLTEDETKIAKSHIKILNLSERYLEKASGKISETVLSYKRIALDSTRNMQELKLILKANADALAEYRGINNWEAVLSNELSISDKFWELCIY